MTTDQCRACAEQVKKECARADELEAERDKLREALDQLFTYQNGPPLFKYEKKWNKAMELASEALGYPKRNS